MSQAEAKAALAGLSDEEAQLLNNSPDLLERFKTKYGLNTPAQEIPSQPQPIYQADANPMSLVAKAAPSNLMKLAGVGGANAPNAANLLISGLPGIGTPSQIVPNLQALSRNPGQVLTAIKRAAAVSQGADLTPKETLPAKIGQYGGTALEVAAQPSIKPQLKPIGPFTAGVAEPSTALPGAFDKAGEALGQAKTAANAGVESPVVGELLTRMENPKDVKSLLTEARNWVSTGMKKPVPNAVLLAYKQVLGEAQAEGGTFANVYAQAGRKVGEKLAEQAPDLSDKMERMATQYVAKGNPKAGFPWLTLAVNPEVGAVKAAMLPVVRNAAGAAVGKTIQQIPRLASLANSVGQPQIQSIQPQNPVIPPAALTLTLEKAKEFLKQAKGIRDKARKLAEKAGYVIPDLSK